MRRRLESLNPGWSEVRWVRPEHYHLTLKFLGETELPVAEALSAVAHPRFTLTFASVGRFPPRGQAKVVWIGVRPDPSLQELFGKVEQALEPLGVAREKRRFQPHLTLGRVRRGSSLPAFEGWARKIGDEPLASLEVGRFELVESQLTPRGPIYKTISVFGLHENTDGG